MRSRNRNGLTLVEVVVTILILLVLAALLLPATRRTRESARRSQCKNNLKHIGLSLMNYHDVHRTLPPGWVASEAKGQSSSFGWNFQILPYFDQAPLFKKFDSNAKLGDPQSDNPQLAASILSATRCPTDRGIDQAMSRWIPKLGTTNYVGNFGVGLPTTDSMLDSSEGELVDPQHCQGIFGQNTSVSIHDVHDGMSNVILVGERRMSENAGEWSAGRVEGNFNSYWAGIPNVDAVSPLVVVATSTGGLTERTPEEIESKTGELPVKGNIPGLQSPASRKSLPFFGINRDVRGEPLGLSDRVTAGFSSWHTGGCQVVLGDGTVRFLHENIDPTIYTNLMRRSDGQTLGEF
tara:strand:- start:38489 stop:39538 length:1050 start_codon:yes stop_codon:yes gene_type:complete